VKGQTKNNVGRRKLKVLGYRRQEARNKDD